jgi:ABC-type polar amino acid transport system ATPase subunit
MITINNLEKRHGSLSVLNGVSLTVKQGDVAALIGPSGGGKSTLLRCINGLESFHAGEIVVDGIHLSSKPDGEALRQLRQRVGMVFQQFHLFPHMSALENVMAGPLIVLNWPREKAEPAALQLLDRVGLKDKRDIRPDKLSGGQQQRVAIARALAVQPQAVLFDEPTSALDPRMANEVLAVISDLARQKLTMIVVTHAMGFARQVASAVYVMAEGRVAESGPPQQIFETPKLEVTRRFLLQASAT